jgi:hypothetical protein
MWADLNDSAERIEEPGVQIESGTETETDEINVAGPKPRRVRNPEVKVLIAEGVRLVDSGEHTMNSAAKLIAKREWRKEIAASEDALADQIRRGISAELKTRTHRFGETRLIPKVPKSPK